MSEENGSRVDTRRIRRMLQETVRIAKEASLTGSLADGARSLLDVFAAFDRERQRRLARRLLETPGRQVFLTAPRLDELPPDLALPVWRMDAGKISP